MAVRGAATEKSGCAEKVQSVFSVAEAFGTFTGIAVCRAASFLKLTVTIQSAYVSPCSSSKIEKTTDNDRQNITEREVPDSEGTGTRGFGITYGGVQTGFNGRVTIKK